MQLLIKRHHPMPETGQTTQFIDNAGIHVLQLLGRLPAALQFNGVENGTGR